MMQYVILLHLLRTIRTKLFAFTDTSIFPMFEFPGPILPQANNASTFENDSSIPEIEWKSILENMETYTQDNNKWQDTILYDNTWNKDNETEWEYMFRMNGM